MNKSEDDPKRHPHAFQPMPTVPIVYPRTGTMYQQGLPGQFPDKVLTTSAGCVVCGRLRSDWVHVSVEEPADDELHWG